MVAYSLYLRLRAKEVQLKGVVATAAGQQPVAVLAAHSACQHASWLLHTVRQRVDGFILCVYRGSATWHLLMGPMAMLLWLNW
jgi:hypothetical protein